VGLKKTALFAALMALCAPAPAFDGAQTVFYVSIPLEGPSSRVSFGLRLQGNREYEAIDIDTRTLRFLPLGGIEAKWILAGAVALGAAAAIRSDKRAQTEATAGAEPRPCPQTCQ